MAIRSQILTIEFMVRIAKSYEQNRRDDCSRMHIHIIYNLSFRWPRFNDYGVPVQTLRQDLRPQIFNVHPSTIMRQGAQIQLRSLRQEIQVQTQTAVASNVECTCFTTMTI